MAGYTFHGLSGADFERLVRDLLRAELGSPLQIFTAGPDAGIDVMLGMRRHHAVVVQCKHYRESGFAKLRSEIATSEVPKVKKLNPRRYILATSVGLTPGNKEELALLLAPHCAGMHDIIGRDDLNALLRDHPAVETSHHKLWLTSTPVLQRVLRQGAALWRDMNLEDIERKMSVYVQTAAYGEGVRLLREHGYCIVSGIPGIGKTTLAEMLVARLLNEDYELICARGEVQEAFDAVIPGKRQVVYYDDFLGQTSRGERLGKNEDHAIVRLLLAARRSATLKVILTTREYILREAQQRHEPLACPEVDIGKCVVKLEDYTRGHRARILYNHLYFSSLPIEHVRSLLSTQTYRRIIDHKNYSPRLVDWMTKRPALARVTAEEFPALFVRNLDHPQEMWGHVFEHQLDADARALLLTLATVADPMAVDDLRDAWAAVCREDPACVPTRDERERFVQALKVLDGTFVRVVLDHSLAMSEFHNPSIRDYVSKRLVEDQPTFQEVLVSARFFEQVWALGHMDGNGRIDLGPTGRVPDGPALRTALLRTWKVPTPLCWDLRTLGASRVRTRQSTDWGERLAQMATWAHRIDSESLMAWVCERTREAIADGHAKEVATVDALKFLDHVVDQWPERGGDFAPLVVALARCIGGRVEHARDPAHWLAWCRFFTSRSSLFTEDEQAVWRIAAEHFCVEQCEYLVEDQETWSEAESQIETFDQIARCVGFPYEDERQKVVDMIEQQQQEDEIDDGSYLCRDDDGGSSGEADLESSDNDIDHLFDSLDEDDTRP